MTSINEQLRAVGVVPVVQITDAQSAPELGRALGSALHIVEITFRTAAASEAIRRMRAECPTVVVGAGTVLSLESVRDAYDAGAAFAVSPGFNPRVVERCLELGLTVIPGVNSPTQVELAMSYGLEVLKFFPAVASGGIPMVKALSGPYPSVSFMATGGITETTAPDWLALPNVAAVGGTWLAPTADISAGAFAAIAQRAVHARSLTANPINQP